MRRRRIRAAILGYGRSGSTMHAGAIEACESFEMAAACDVDGERRRQAAERFGCAVYDDYHRMLDREQLDLVSVVTRSDQHCRMTCECLAAGVNVLVTKPWAVNEGEARRMVAAAERSGKLLLPWLPSRWACDLKRLKGLLAEGAIGKVFMIRRAICDFAARDDWQTRRRFGGGYLLNWGPHVVDPPLVLAGSPVRSVYGRMRRTINPGDAEDLFLAVMTLADGTIVQAEYTVAVEGPPNWFIQGDRGTIVVRGNRIRILRRTPERRGDPTDPAAMAAGEGQVAEESLAGRLYGDEKEIYAEVARALRGAPGETAFPVAPADALALSRVLDAIRTASEEDRVVRL